MPRRTTATPVLLGDNLHAQAHLDLGMQAQWDLMRAKGSNGLVEVPRLAVDLDPGLGLHGLGDVGRGHRTGQAAPRRGPGGDVDRDRGELGRDLFGARTVAGVAYGPRTAHRL